MSSEHSISVFLVDDHPVVREGLQALFSQHPEFKVIGEAADGISAVTNTLACDMSRLISTSDTLTEGSPCSRTAWCTITCVCHGWRSSPDGRPQGPATGTLTVWPATWASSSSAMEPSKRPSGCATRCSSRSGTATSGTLLRRPRLSGLNC